jgi:hypothetical protein
MCWAARRRCTKSRSLTALGKQPSTHLCSSAHLLRTQSERVQGGRCGTPSTHRRSGPFIRPWLALRATRRPRHGRTAGSASSAADGAGQTLQGTRNESDPLIQRADQPLIAFCRWSCNTIQPLSISCTRRSLAVVFSPALWLTGPERFRPDDKDRF